MPSAPAAPSKPAGVVPDPNRDAVGYLLAHGWDAEGDPEEDTGRWLDPTKPRKETTERVKIGEKKLPNGKVEPILQTVVTPPAWPLSRAEAVRIQKERDRAKK